MGKKRICFQGVEKHGFINTCNGARAIKKKVI